MIVECQTCNKKLNISDNLIPSEGRLVQCGFCNSKWHQKPLNESKEKIVAPFSVSKKIKIKQKKRDIEEQIYIPKSKKLHTGEKNKKNIGFLSYLFVFIISILALFLVLETFKNQIINYWPEFDNYFNYIYETLNNIFILIKDLFKSY
tara:strand:+ start:154 stop:597 length:444 start_codon:yes stop_codon:yes gene_type:complete